MRRSEWRRLRLNWPQTLFPWSRHQKKQITIYRAVARCVFIIIVQVHLENTQVVKSDGVKAVDFVHVVDVYRVGSIARAQRANDSCISGCSKNWGRKQVMTLLPCLHCSDPHIIAQLLIPFHRRSKNRIAALAENTTPNQPRPPVQ